MMRRFAFLAALSLSFPGAGALAADAGKGAQATLPAVANGALPVGNGAAPGTPPEYRMQDVEIRGELERPDVFYIIPRRKAKMDLGQLTKSYEKEIMEPLDPAEYENRPAGSEPSPK